MDIFFLCSRAANQIFCTLIHAKADTSQTFNDTFYHTTLITSVL